jgi:hypothetical protein
LKTFATEAERDQFAATVDVIDRGHIDLTIDRGLAKHPIVAYFYGACHVFHRYAHSSRARARGD